MVFSSLAASSSFLVFFSFFGGLLLHLDPVDNLHDVLRLVHEEDAAVVDGEVRVEVAQHAVVLLHRLRDARDVEVRELLRDDARRQRPSETLWYTVSF